MDYIPFLLRKNGKFVVQLEGGPDTVAVFGKRHMPLLFQFGGSLTHNSDFGSSAE